MDTFSGPHQRAPRFRRYPMSVRRRPSANSHVVQSALALGHAEVRWDALPAAVQGEVLARWSELLRDVIAPSASACATADANTRESRG